MAKPLDLLRGADEPAGAAAHRLAFLAHRVAAADRAFVGKCIGLGGLRALLQHHAQNLRDDVARALDGDGVADAHVLARDLVLVVQAGILHHDAADRDRLELGDGGERAGAPDLDVDAVDDCRRPFGREFMRQRPARMARDKAQPLLPVDAVDLVDDAVDVVIERGALALDLAVEGQHLLERAADFHQRIGVKAAAREPLHHARLGLRRHVAHLAPGIGEKAERPRRRDAHVFLPQRSRRRVARIGEDRFTRFRLALVEREESRLGHVDLAAHLADVGYVLAAQTLRDVLQRSHIGGDVFAFGAVAARRGNGKLAFLVSQRQRHAVDFRLGGEDRRLVEAEKAADALDKIRDVLLAEGIVEREHRQRMPHLGESSCRRGADTPRRRIGAD